jgi:hypothetical protein
MKTPFRFAADGKSMALVIVFPPGVKGLFNSEIHGLVREIQEQLDGVYVTYALSSGTSPDLRAAMVAARFVGCDSAVAVPVGASDVVNFVDHDSPGDWLLTTLSVRSRLDAQAVIDSYLEAVVEAGRAA